MANNIDIIIRAQNLASSALRSIEKDLGSLQTQGNVVTRGFSGLQKAVGTGMVAAAGTAVVALGALGAGLASAVSAGSDVEEMMGKFGVVFANTGDDVANQLDAFSKAVGRNKYELREMAATFGDTLKPMGFAESDAADLAVQMSKLAVDLGSFNNMDTDEALRRLQGTLIGSHENALAFGVVINENTLAAEMAANGWDTLTGTQLEAAKVQARINLLMKGTTDAQGDAERTSGGWANQMRRLQSILAETQAEIGTKLLPVITPLLTKLGDLASQYAPQAIDAFVKILDKVVDFAIALASWDTTALPFLQTLQDIGTRIVEVVGPIIGAIDEFVDWQDVMIALGGVVASIVLPFLWGVVTAAAPVVAVFAGLVAAVALVRTAWENDWGGIRELVSGVVESITTAYQGWKDGTLTLPEAIGSAFEGIKTAIADRLPGWIETLKGWADAAWQWILDAVPVVLEKLGEWSTGLITAMAEKLPDFLAGIYEWATAIVAWIGEAIPKAIESLTEFVANLGQTGDSEGGSVLGETAGKWVGMLIDWVVNDLIPKVGPAFLKFAGELLLALGKIGLALGELALTIGQTVLEAMLDGMRAGWDAIVNWFSTLKLPNLNPFNINLGNISIPGFARGTNFAPGGLAVVGENGPELINLPRGSQVIPQNRMQASNNGSASGGIVVNVNATVRNEIDISILTENIMRELRRRQEMQAWQPTF